MRNPTIRDVAKRAGVGVGTVSRVLNDSPQVRDETRQRVQAAIAELGFRPNAAAQQLSGGKTWTVGVLSPFFTQPSFIERIKGIQDALDESDYDLVLYSIRSAEHLKRRLMEIINRRRLDGLVILTLPIDEDALSAQQPDLPVVLVLEQKARLYPHIIIDNHAGGRLATDYVIERDHTLIGFLGDSFEDDFGIGATRSRYEGFQAALDAAGLPCVKEWCTFSDEHSIQAAYEQAYRILQEPDHPTAMIASSDTMAFGILKAAHILRLRVPQDLAVIGFDDLPAAEMMRLTTVRQPLFESGRLATERLLEWLAQGGYPEAAFRTVLPLEVVQRESV